MKRKFLAGFMTVLIVLTTVLSELPPVTAWAATAVTITKSGGWFESAYVEWQAVSGAKSYRVSVKKSGGSYEQLDDELVRQYEGGVWRADAVGLAAGTYTLKVEANVNGSYVASETGSITVDKYDRTGFAWQNGTASGAYNEDGTLKSNAVVLYITKDTVDSVELDVVTSSKGTVTSCKGITNILTAFKKGYDSRPLAIRFIGTVNNDGLMTSDSNFSGDFLITGSGDTKRLSNGITVEGIGEDAVALGWGVRLKNTSNVEVRNLAFMLCDSKEGDNVGLQQSNDHIWVHNCDMFYGLPGGDADQAKGDGALDCKKSTYVTFSYNHFWDSGKCNLLGLSEGTTEGLYITYHHNWYDHSDSRHPRVRYYSAHVYNNYYDGNAKYGVGSTLGSSVFVEGNYFRNCPYPILTSMQGSDVFAAGTTKNLVNATFSKEAGGTIKAFNNIMTGSYTFIPYGASSYYNKGNSISYNLSGTNSSADFDAYVVTSASQVVPESVASSSGGNTYNNFDTKSNVMYSYTADAPEDVPAKVSAYAGRMNGGDFSWEFNDSVDDADHGVNQALMTAIKAYKTKLVSVGGGADASSSDVTLKGIVVTPSSKSLTVGSTVNLSVTPSPSNASITDTVTYSSDNTSVATVSSTGKVTAVATGTANITAKANGYSAKCVVTVTSSSVAITGISLSKSSIEMTAGESTTISASALPTNATESLGTVTWSSNNSSVATVSNGIITAVAAGTATITGTANGFSANCTVKVNAVGSEALEKGDAPIASRLDATLYEEEREFDLQWVSSEVGSGDGKYVIEVARKNSKTEDAIYETIDTVSYAQTYYTYVPKKTGYYTFRVYGKINGTMTEFIYSAEDQYVFVPLEAPVVTMKQGDASMTLSWTADEERVISYDVEYCKADLSKRFDDDAPTFRDYTYTTKVVGTTAKTITFTDLDVNSYYYFKITAHADDGEKSVGYANGYFIKNDANKTFKMVNMGTGAKAGKVSGSFGSKLTIIADGSKFADSEDGFTYYYTPINANENFILTATFTVTSADAADNQSAMGIIATDTVSTTSPNVAFKYFNSITCGACKLIPPTTGGQAIYRVPGVRYVTGYLDSSASVPYDPNSTLANPPGLRNMVNKYVFTNDQDKGFVNGSTYTFTLRKSNTGYEGTMSGSDGTYVLYDPASLLVQDSGKMYVGFFAARNITVEVTDMVMTTISAANDEAKVDAPPKYIDKNVFIYSPSHSTSYNYDFVYRPTFAGTLTVKDDSGNVIVSNQHIDAKEYFTKSIVLKKDTTTLTATITPDANQLLEDFSAVEVTKTITVNKFGTEGQTLVVTPTGSALGTGSQENPLDIYTAVAYAQPGQTILLKNGTYNLKEKLTIERGHNGTADKPIKIIAESIDNIVADRDNGVTDAQGVKFNLAGLDMKTGTAFEVAGDYWHIYGIEIYNTPHDVKTIQVSGNHNTLEMMLVHDVGNSGIQISGSSKETIEHWPSYNTILNCEVYNCCDAKMNDADGFAAKLTSGYGNVFKGCISHHNIDDGWDLYAKSTTGLIGEVIIEDCVTYANGRLTTFAEDGYTGEGNGFKLGGESMPVDHQLINSITFDNGAKGVTSNSNPNGIIKSVICYNNAFISKAENFSLYTNSAKNTNYTVENLISMSSYAAKQDKRALVKNGVVTAKSTELDSNINFFWTGSASQNKAGTKATTSWFNNTDTTIIPTRNADGTINMHGLLEPTSTLTSAITFDYAKLQGTTGEISDVNAAVTAALANAITDSNGTPTKVEIISAPSTTLDGASIDLTGAKIRVTYSSGAVVDKDMVKEILNKSIFYYADGATQTVTVEVAEGVSTTFQVTVVEKSPESLEWDVKPLSTVSQNASLDVTGAKLLVNYNNGTSEYVTISGNMVSLDSSKLGAATATITYKGLTITHDVTVVASQKPITGITISNTTAAVKVGANFTLTTTITPADTTDGKLVSWTSSDETVATVVNGVVTGVSEGSAVITAYVSSSTLGTLSARCVVTVSAAGSATTYNVTVTNGTASPASATAGTTVTITANTISGKTFKNWNVVSGSVTLASSTSATTTFTMPSSDVSIEAVYESSSSGGGEASGDAQVWYYGCTNSYFTSTVKSTKNGGSYTINGTAYTTQGKLESLTNIKFSTSKEAEVVIYVMGKTANKTIEVDGVEYTLTGPAAVDEVKVTLTTTGEHTIAKGSAESWVFYVSVTEKSSTPVEEDADYSAVDAAIATVPSDLTIYTDSTVAAVNAAVSAVVRGKKVSEQSVVDGYATAITNAVNALVVKDADYTAVDAALATVPSDLTKYTDSTAAAVTAAVNAVVRGKKITEQSVVDGYATAITNAVNALVLKSTDDKNGLNKATDGNWYYYENGSVNTNKTGIVENNAGKWYVENGVLDFNKSGVIEDNGVEYVVKYGYMSTGYYGLTRKDDGTWAYAEAGVLTYKYTGLAKNDFGWWYVTDGVIDFTYTGIGTNQTGSYRVQNGQLDFSYNGWFRANDGEWYYIRGGMVDTDKNGLQKLDDKYYYLTKGQIDFKYTGLAENAGVTYYVKYGYLDFSFSGTVTVDGVEYNVKNGIVQ